MCLISVGCDSCNPRYHPTHVCTGLLDSIINTIKEFGGRGINFCYTSCRLEGRSGSNGPQSGSIVDGSVSEPEHAVKQLFETLKSFSAEMATLTNNT